MRLKFAKTIGVAFIASAFFLLIVGCGGSQSNEKSSLIDSTANTILKVNNKIFSLPSPLQTALLIRGCGVKYKKELLTDPGKSESYVSNFSKAINLGIYGTDLGYSTIYDQKQDAFAYMKAAKSLTEGLGISDIFNADMIKRLNMNFNNKDSLLALISDGYGKTNAYLINNEQSDVSGLVLTGGWIESLYLTTEIYKLGFNEEVKRRIAEQKTSLERVRELLKPYNDRPEYAGLIAGLKKMDEIYQNIGFKNTYVQASTDAKKKLTIINCKTEIEITEQQIKDILATVKEIRSQLTQ